jgi:limonene-1,2-epoxide hydrolase
MAAMEEAETVVQGFCDAFAKHDAEALRPFFADEVFYHNIPMDPCEGIDATIAFIDGFFAMCDAMTIETTHLAVRDSIVLTERIDTFWVGEVGASSRHGYLRDP